MSGRFTRKGRNAAYAIGAGLGLLSLLFAVTLFAQRSDKATVVTFNSPVEIPGSHPQVLPAGTYMFKLVDSKSSPHIVQVSNKEESKVYSTIMAIPAHRDATTKDTVITFEERGGGQPQAVQTWFYPNDTNGEEFVYSEPLPQVAKATPTPTVTPLPKREEETTTPAPVAQAEAPAPAPTPAPAPPVAETPRTPEPAQQPAAAPPPQAPTPAPVQTPSAQEQPQPQQNAQPQNNNNEEKKTLPHTASNLPVLLLAGLLSLGAGLTLRGLSRG
jgi:hypothetical protein